MEIKHCPTEQMIADFYTKPIQGKQFYKLRNVIMGHDTMPAEKCIGTTDKIAILQVQLEYNDNKE